jgi:hypothetical protein
MTQRSQVPFSQEQMQHPDLAPNEGLPSFDVSETTSVASASLPHELERAIMHVLQRHPSLKFTRLAVHQCNRDSVCLEGVLEANEDDVVLSDVVRGVHDFKEIIDRVVPPKSSVKAPKKG